MKNEHKKNLKQIIKKTNIIITKRGAGQEAAHHGARRSPME